MAEHSKVLQVKALKKTFDVGHKQVLRAVDGVSFDLYEGETLGLVGESGCGKSTTGRTIMRLYKATSGEVLLDGREVQTYKSRRDLSKFSRDIQMVFQDPDASLDPRMTIEDIVAEGIIIHKLIPSKEERHTRVKELLEMVGLTGNHAVLYPHQLSGGQRQRVGIARALAVNPRIIICDEPISALDVSIQAQIVNLLRELQGQHGLTYLFIAHDLAMVRYISDRVGVMYLGKMAELAPTEQLYENPLHPYTRVLLSAVPVPDPKLERAKELIKVDGELPNPIHPPSGCRFRTRCPMAMDVCSQQEPDWQEVEPGRWVACHLYGADDVQSDNIQVVTE